MTTTTRMMPASIRAGKGKGQVLGFIPFNSPSELISERGRRFVEVIKRGAFAFTRNVRALLNHDDSKFFGDTAGGALKLEQKDDGLYVTLNAPDTAAGQSLHRAAKAGDLKGVSFSFDMNAGHDEWLMDESPIKHVLHKIRVDEISFLTVAPAYSETEVSARAKGGGDWQPDAELQAAIYQCQADELHQFPSDIAADEERDAAASKRALVKPAEPPIADPTYWLSKWESEAV